MLFCNQLALHIFVNMTVRSRAFYTIWFSIKRKEVFLILKKTPCSSASFLTIKGRINASVPSNIYCRERKKILNRLNLFSKHLEAKIRNYLWRHEFDTLAIKFQGVSYHFLVQKQPKSVKHYVIQFWRTVFLFNNTSCHRSSNNVDVLEFYSNSVFIHFLKFWEHHIIFFRKRYMLARKFI